MAAQFILLTNPAASNIVKATGKETASPKPFSLLGSHNINLANLEQRFNTERSLSHESGPNQ